ncbi:MAG: metallophosphatase family protein [Peptococcaceae bacterium]|nr:metallophosphatase family protein [Peptococcaceae bacterium]
MKIAVISDTHFREKENRLPPEVEKILREIGFIVHCGDFEDYFAYEKMKELGRLTAVCGNMDNPRIREILPAKLVFEAAGYKIGVTHGDGPPVGIEDRVAAQFSEKVDVILFGHSHRPQNQVRNGVLFFNPGSPTDKRFAPFNSYGIIELAGNQVRGEIFKLE